MTLRFSRPLALALLASAACTPSIPNQAPPSTVAYAVSFPDASDGTQAFLPAAPNDLALQAAFSSTPPAVSGAQLAFLKALSAGGGWPNDQEVPITIQLFAVKVDPSGGAATPAPFPDLDTATITPSTFALVKYDGATPTPVDFEVGGYDQTTGTLTLRKKLDATTGNRWWAPGRYVAALRSGSNGVKTKAGDPIAAQVSTLLISQDKDLTLEDNQTLLKTLPDPKGTAAKLEAIRQLYAKPVGWGYTAAAGWAPGQSADVTTAPLAAIDKAFSHREIASLQTFVVDPNPHVAIDPAGGVVPLPSEFLMQASYYAPVSGSTGPLFSKVANQPAFGALAPGLATLDGFSTTGMIMVPTSGTPVAAASISSSSVVLLRRAKGDQSGSWSRVTDFTTATPGGRYLTEPPPITIDAATGNACVQPYGATCAAKLIGLQPAVAVPLPAALGGGYRALPPLEDHTQYAVILTSDVKDLTGAPLTPGTVAKLMHIAAPVSAGGLALPLVDGSGKSQLVGVSDANAQQLQGLAAVVPAETVALVTQAAGLGVDPTKVVFAYTFPTQSIQSVAAQLAALPVAAGLPAALVAVGAPMAPDVAARKFGLSTAALRNPSNPAQFLVGDFVEAALVTGDLLDPATGAFKNPPVPSASTIPVLIARPPSAVLTANSGNAPLVIFRHALNGGRAQMLSIAGALAGQGAVVVAIDAAKFGDRSWCTTDADCAGGATCDHGVFGDQGDAATAKPGVCMLDGAPGPLVQTPVQAGLPACSATVTSECWDGTGGVAKASGAFLVSANLFRLRDSMRQDVIDENALARAVLGSRAALGITAFTGVFFVGQSQGSINGVVDVAANALAGGTPGFAFTREVFNVGGGTFADIAQDSPTFKPVLAQLVSGLGIQPGTAAYLQFIHVAKWVIDPADPVNFAPVLTAANVLGQAARCDNVVPNPENALLYGLMGVGLSDPPAGAGLSPLEPTAPAASAKLEWFMADATTACPTDGTTGQGASHGFLLDFKNQSLTVKAQTAAATFLFLGTTPATTPVLP